MFVNFEVDHLKKKKNMKKLAVYEFPCTWILPTLRVLPCIETLTEQAVCLKRFRTAAFESSHSLFLLRLNTIPTWRL